MAVTTTLALAALFGLGLRYLPRELLRRYCETFRERHGYGAQIGLTILVTLVTIMLIATLVQPGHEAMELVNAAVIAGLGLAGMVDLLLFSRGR